MDNNNDSPMPTEQTQEEETEQNQQPDNVLDWLKQHKDNEVKLLDDGKTVLVSTVHLPTTAIEKIEHLAGKVGINVIRFFGHPDNYVAENKEDNQNVIITQEEQQ